MLFDETRTIFRYFPEPQKSYLVVAPDSVQRAETLFGDLGIKVVTGQRFLGGFIGDESGKDLYVRKKTEQWCDAVEKLSKQALTQPQAAFSAFTKSLQCEWAYLHRVMPDFGTHFGPLEKAIKEQFLPSLFGSEVSANERELFSLPCRIGGIGVRNPESTAKSAYETSREASEVVVDSIKRNRTYNSLDHRRQIETAKCHLRIKQSEEDSLTLERILGEFDVPHQRAIKRISENKISSWLTVLPLSQYQFDLSAVEFRDALALRYRRPLLNLPALCDGCGEQFTVDHAMNCKKGGLIIQRHNEIRDALGDLANLAWSQVHREPVVREADEAKNIQALVADLGIRGVWQPQTLALLDIRVINTDAESHLARPVRAVLTSAEAEKKKKYKNACDERRAAFTPFISSVDGVLGPEAAFFMKCLIDRLEGKWKRNRAEIANWTRTRLSFATLRATCQCIRSSRKKWRSLGVEDGAPIRFALQ